MIVKTIKYDIEAYAGETFDSFLMRIAKAALEDVKSPTSYGHAYRNNVTVTGKHNDTTISLDIKHSY